MCVGGSNIFQGGGVQLLTPMESYRTCDFPLGPEPPVPPSVSAHVKDLNIRTNAVQ